MFVWRASASPYQLSFNYGFYLNNLSDARHRSQCSSNLSVHVNRISLNSFVAAASVRVMLIVAVRLRMAAVLIDER